MNIMLYQEKLMPTFQARGVATCWQLEIMHFLAQKSPPKLRPQVLLVNMLSKF